jgi:glucosamine-phosphate N-acetyltransferase
MEPRPLQASDYGKGFFPLLQQLTAAPQPSYADFLHTLHQQQAQGKLTLVVEDGGQLVATVSLLTEHKMLHGCRPVMHLEDLVVVASHRKRGLASMLIRRAQQLARDSHCYKLILNCSDELLPFYCAQGLECRGKQMALYF